MATPTIVWDIDWMKASTQVINGFSEVVLTCGWRCNGSETNTATPPVTVNNSIYGTCSFPEPKTGDTFTPYASLTKDEVLNWCWTNGVNKSAAEESMATSLNLLLNPLEIQPALPWAKA